MKNARRPESNRIPFPASSRWACFSGLLATALLASTTIARAGDETDLDSSQRAAIVNKINEVMGESYIFEDLALEMAAGLRSKLADGSYDEQTDLTEFCRQLTTHLVDISKDRHIRITPIAANDGADLESEPDPEANRRLLARLKARNFGFHQIERLPGNIGYLDLRSFEDPEVAKPTAVAALQFLAHSDALIIDLRQNGGGQASMVQLIASYFFDEPVHLTTHHSRLYDSTNQMWTHEVEGERLTDIPLYFLTASRTFSAAEALPYHLQAHGRAKVVGEVTGGGAHPSEHIKVPELDISIKTPFMNNVNPITGTDWERVGVKPDLVVPAAKALPTACIEALKGLKSEAATPNGEAQIDFLIERYEGQLDPVRLGPADYAQYLGAYSDGRVSVQIVEEADGLVAVIPGRQPMPLSPMGQDAFSVLERANMHIQRDEAGEVSGVTITLKQGDQIMTFECSRSDDVD